MGRSYHQRERRSHRLGGLGEYIYHPDILVEDAKELLPEGHSNHRKAVLK